MEYLAVIRLARPLPMDGHYNLWVLDLPEQRGVFRVGNLICDEARCELARSDTMARMSIDELESEAMKLDPKARARLAGKLLESLEALSEKENERLWAEEAKRRDSDSDSDQDGDRSADDVLRDARGRLG